MKNLSAFIRKNIKFNHNVLAHCVDSDNGIIYVLNTELKITKAQIYSKEAIFDDDQSTGDLGQWIQNKISQDDIRLFDFVVELGSILLALKNGNLLLISGSSPYQFRSIYMHEKNISSISLSPSQDIIALADEDNDIQIMSCFDCIITNKSNALTESGSLFKPVGVGWGSKETQFFGLDGRPSREKQHKDKLEMTEQELDTSNRIEASLEYEEFRKKHYRATLIDWRGDGQFIATLTYIPVADKHYLKVWNRNLELQYMSEQLITIERGLLSWVPNGHFISTAQRRDRRNNEVVLFEKNGLVRQRITLPTMLPDMYISSMSWSTDSAILAIVSRLFHIEDETVKHKDVLMLYTMQNWHYYLKFSTVLQSSDCDYSLKWDTINPYRLHTMSSTGRYLVYDCNFNVTFSAQHSTVSVVDSNKIQFTPLGTCVIPPPMSASTLEIPVPVYRLVVNQRDASNIFIYTLDNQLICTSMDLKEDLSEQRLVKVVNQVSTKLVEYFKKFKVHTVNDAQSHQHIVAVDKNHLVAIKSTEHGSELLLLTLPDNNDDIIQTKVIRCMKDQQVISMSRYPSDSLHNLAIVLDDGSCFLLSTESYNMVQSFNFQPSIVDSRFNYSIVDLQTIDLHNETSVISLGQDFCLRYNQETIATNCCTSFRLTSNYLVYTTTDNHMHFILLEQLFGKKINNSLESWSQPIETGGTLVIASETSSKVVLQMPRGNLETLHPRVLLFSTITKLLDDEKFAEACQISRKHRVNTNFLIDYIMSTTSQQDGLGKFAMALVDHDPSYLSLVISELDNSDTLTGRYGSILKHIPPRRLNQVRTRSETESKINEVCLNLSIPDRSDLLNVRIQSLLKMDPKEMAQALRIVHQLNDEVKNEALKFMLYFVEIDQLFNEALGTYDTDIALMVATVSNKDPKEYLALLKSLSETSSDNLRRYKIDLHIKRYEAAFINLLNYHDEVKNKDEIHQQVINFANEKRLLRFAVVYLSEKEREDVLAEEIWTNFANYLFLKRHYTEAGISAKRAYEICPKMEYFELALKCFSMANDWEKSLIFIDRSNLEESAKKQAIKKLTKQLFSMHKLYEAITINHYNPEDENLDIYGNCSDLAASKNYYLAEFVSLNQNKVEFRKTLSDILLDSSTSEVCKLQSTLDQELTEAQERYKRLCELLIAPKPTLSEQERFYVGDSLSTVDGSELSSMMSDNPHEVNKARSGATSIKTRSTAKTKSSMPTSKRLTLKPGSRYEDLALVMELKKFISKQKSHHEEAIEITGTLFFFCPLLKALEFHNSLRRVLKKSLMLSHEMLDALWPATPYMDQKYSLYKKFNRQFSENYENIDFEVLIKPDVPKELNCLDFL